MLKKKKKGTQKVTESNKKQGQGLNLYREEWKGTSIYGMPSIMLGILCLLIYSIFIKTVQREKRNAPFSGGGGKTAKGVTFRNAAVMSQRE